MGLGISARVLLDTKHEIHSNDFVDIDRYYTHTQFLLELSKELRPLVERSDMEALKTELADIVLELEKKAPQVEVYNSVMYRNVTVWPSTIAAQKNKMIQLQSRLEALIAKAVKPSESYDEESLLALLTGIKVAAQILVVPRPVTDQAVYEGARDRFTLFSTLLNTYASTLENNLHRVDNPKVENRLSFLIGLLKSNKPTWTMAGVSPQSAQILVSGQQEWLKKVAGLLDEMQESVEEQMLAGYSTPLGQLKRGSAVYHPETKTVVKLESVAKDKNKWIVKTPSSKSIETDFSGMVAEVESFKAPNGHFHKGDKVTIPLEEGQSGIATIEQLFPDAAVLKWGENTTTLVKLSQLQNISAENRVLSENISSELKPLWFSYEASLRSDVPGRAQELISLMNSILEPPEKLEIPLKNHLARNAQEIFERFPDLPRQLKQKLESVSKVLAADQIQKSQIDAEPLTYQDSETDLLGRKMLSSNDLSKFYESVTEKETGRAVQLKQLVDLFNDPANQTLPAAKTLMQEAPAGTKFSIRSALDYTASKLLTEFPELPVEIRSKLAKVLRAPTSEHLSAAQAPVRFPENSVIDSPELLHLERNLAKPLGAMLEASFPVAGQPVNDRTIRLNSLIKALSTRDLNLAPAPLSKHHYFENIGRSLLHEFPELSLELKARALQLIPKPTEADQKLATESPKTLYPELTLSQNHFQRNSVAESLQTGIRNLPPLLPGNRTDRLNHLKNLLSNLTRSQTQIKEAALALGLKDQPVTYETLQSGLAKTMIEEFPELPQNLRKSLLTLVPNPDSSLIEKAERNAQRPGGSEPAIIPAFSIKMEDVHQDPMKNTILLEAKVSRHHPPIAVEAIAATDNNQSWMVVPQNEFENALNYGNKLSTMNLPAKMLSYSYYGPENSKPLSKPLTDFGPVASIYIPTELKQSWTKMTDLEKRQSLKKFLLERIQRR